MDLGTAYRNSQARIIELLDEVSATEEGRVVPACPDWTVHDLAAHLSGIPESIAAGDLPTGEFQPWLDRIVEERRDVPLGDLVDRWRAVADTAASIAEGAGGLLTCDVVIHEHDLRAALGRPGHRDAEELAAVLPGLLTALQPGIEERGLGPLAVVSPDGRRWQSHEGEPGCTLLVEVWTATRALESRRTADELQALPAQGAIGPYVEVIAAHLPLPERSLGE